MRNLKKILALVLALVMSLSLMATAGAADAAATSSETVTPAYEIALQVLGKDGLKVFGGYTDGTIRPQNNITRAEVAAILYRIVTGDVTDAQAGIYTDMANVNFNDLTGANWAKGYINYCANAQLIVGVGGNQFKPLANITGYATLAMILRALGYDKNGEFKGSGWEIRTASKARELGILKNVSENLLGSAATRELVAELLFRAMLCDKVTYNALTQDYDKTGVTLGYSVFTLEEVKGVVVANEYADIRDKKNTTAKDDTTVLRDAAGKDRTVNYASGLEDLGETRVAYTIENGKRDQYDLKNVKLENPGVDSIAYDGGEEKTAAQVTALIGRTDDNTKHLINFGESADRTDTTIKVTYVATAIVERISARTTAEAIDRFFEMYPFLDKVAAAANVTAALAPTSYVGGGLYDVTYRPSTVGTGDFVAQRSWAAGHTYSVVNNVNGATLFLKVEIAPNSVFNAADDRIVTSIFNQADLVNGGTLIEQGAVYRGTQTLHDYSDWRSYEAFLEDCFDIDENTTRVTTNGNGYWLKVIDNDDDGVTDWVFQTRYTVASVDTAKDDGTITLETDTPSTTSWGDGDNVNRMVSGVKTVAEDTGLAAGDVVLYAVIDGVARVWKAESVDVRVDTVNRNALTATVEGNSEPYVESVNHEHSSRNDIGSFVANLAGKTNYIFYLDKYGYLAAFSQDVSGEFTLLTKGWFHNLKNGSEYAVTAWNNENNVLTDYDVTSGGNLFINSAVNDRNGWYPILNFAPLNTNPARDDVHTMVAYMETDGENASLLPVDVVYDEITSQNNRVIDMIDLGTYIPTQNIPAAANLGTLYETTRLSAGNIYSVPRLANSVEVRALSTTQYWYVYQTRVGDPTSIVVKEIEGYSNGAGYLTNAEQAKYVEDVYAMGTLNAHINATVGSAGYQNYYTANIVVVELNDLYYQERNEWDEVFIYDFESVNNRVDREAVKAISPTGEDTTYTIDPTLSTGLDHFLYNEAGSKTMPGLFYLRETAVEGVYAVDRMTHAQIRASGNYDVGTVQYAEGVLGANYYQAKNWTCNGAGVDDHATTTALNPNIATAPLSETSAKRNVEDTSKYYTLGYGSNVRNAATLTSTTARTALREDIGDNINGGANQVLVRHNGGSSIVYAISFNHGTNTNEDGAQRVWRSVLLNPVVSVDFDLTFYGERDTDGNHVIEIPYAVAKAFVRDNPTVSDALSVKGTGVTYLITKDGAKLEKIPATPIPVVETTYYVEVTKTATDGTKTTEVYTLIVDKADTTTGLEATLQDGSTERVDPSKDYEYKNIPTSVENVKNYFHAVAPATIDPDSWKFYDEKHNEVESVNWANGYTATVTVVAENGETKQEYTIVFGETVKPTPDPVNLEVKIGETGENVKTFYTDPTTYGRVNLNSKFAGLSNAAFTNGETFSMTKDDTAPATGDYISAAYLNSIANNGKWELKVEVNGTDVTATETAAGFDFGEITADTTIVFTYTFKTETLPSGGGETGGEVPVGPRPIEPSAARAQVLADSGLRAEVVYRYVNKGAEKIYVWNSVENGFANGVDVITPKYPCPIDDDDIAYLESQGVDVDPADKDIWAIGYRYKASEGAPDLIVWSYEPYNKPDTPTAVTGVTLNKAEETVVVGKTVTLTATVAPETATNKNVTWTSSDETVATVADGVVTGVAAGTATITVTTEDGGKTAACEVTVAAEAVAVTGVTLDKTEETVAVDGTVTLTATVAPETATNKNVTWTSSDETVATVADGVVTGVAAGTATITVTTEDGEFTADCEITVVAETVAVTGVTLDQETATVAVGEEVTLEATVAPEEATNKNVTWESDDETVATVEDGVVTGVAAGTVTITVTTEDGEFTDTCEVTVEEDIAVETTVVLKGTTGAAIASVKGEDGQAIEADPANTYAATTGDELSVELTIEGTPKYVVAVDKDGKVSEVTKTGDKYIAAITVAADAEYTFRVTNGELELFYPADPTYDSSNNWIEESSIALGTAIIDVAGNATGSTTVADVVNNITTGLGAEVKVTAVYDADHVIIPESAWTRYASSSGNSVIGTIEVTVDGKAVVISEANDPSLADLVLIKDEDDNIITTAEKGEDVTLNLAAGYYSIYDGTNYKQVTSGALAAAESDNWSTAPLAAATTVKFQIASDATYTELTVRDARWELIVDGASAEKVKADDPATAKVTGLTAANGNWYVVYETPAEGEPTLTTADYKELVADKTDSEKKMVPDFAMPAHNTTVTTKLFRIDVTTVDGETSTTETKFLATDGSVPVASGKKAIVQVKGASTNTVVDASDEAKTVAVEGKDKEITIADGSRIASLTLNDSSVNILLGTTSKLNWYEWLVAQGVDENTYVKITVNNKNQDISGKNLANADPDEATYLKVSELEALDPQTVADNTVVTTGFVKLTIKDESYADVAVKYATGTTVIGSGDDVDSAEVSVYVEKGTGVKIGTTDEFYTITVTGTPKAPVQSTTDGLWRGTISEDTVWTVVVKAIDDVSEPAE